MERLEGRFGETLRAAEPEAQADQEVVAIRCLSKLGVTLTVNDSR
jgi:hypothetical protein